MQSFSEQFLIISNILLLLAVIALALVVFALARQVGVLYERVAPAGALAINQQINTGERAPEISVETLDSQLLTIAGEQQKGRSQLLFFISPDCPVCKQLLVPLLSSAHSEKNWLDLVLASDGENADEHRAFIKREGLGQFPYVLSELLGKRYGVSKLPYAILIDEDNRVSSMGIINSREHLESLFEAKERGVGSLQEYIGQTQTNRSAQNNQRSVDTTSAQPHYYYDAYC